MKIMNMDKMNETMAQIVSIAHHNDVIIFGGYLRDYFAKMIPTDIDIFFKKGPESFDDFSKHISRLLFVKIQLIESDYICNEIKSHHHRIFLMNESISHIDCIVPARDLDTWREVNPWGLKTDCDVNLLMLSKNSLYVRNGYDLLTIIENCQERRFKAGKDVEPDRIQKMIERGFVNISERK